MKFTKVDGSYEEWGTWGSCSKTCEENAVRIRERNCTAPTCGGTDCQPVDEVRNGTTVTVGANDTEACNQGIPCPSKLESF